MSSFFKDLREFVWLYRQGFRPTEYLRNSDRISLHACGWRANGSGRMKTARDAVAYLEGSKPEQWRQVYCGLTPFLVSDRGNVRLIDGSEPRMLLANGRYQIAYKPEEQHPSRRGRRGGMAHKKRVYRSVLVAMAFLDFKKGDSEHEVHHVNGYRTDDRLVNLMVLTHDEHTRIHNMGPCGLTAPLDEAVHDAGLLAEMKPMGKMKLRRVKKKALERALEAPQAPKMATASNNEAKSCEATCAPEAACSESNKPNREAIIPAPAPAGTFACGPLPVLDETGVFTTPKAPEIAAIEHAEKEKLEADRRAAEEKAAAEAAELAAIPARGEHKAEEKSSLQAAAEEGLAEVAEKLDAAHVRSGARAQETLNGEGPTKAAKRRASKKRAEARRAEERSARRGAAHQIAREEAQPDSDILNEATEEAERVSEYPQNAFIAAESEVAAEEAAAESEAAIEEIAAFEALVEATVSEAGENPFAEGATQYDSADTTTHAEHQSELAHESQTKDETEPAESIDTAAEAHSAEKSASARRSKRSRRAIRQPAESENAPLEPKPASPTQRSSDSTQQVTPSERVAPSDQGDGSGQNTLPDQGAPSEQIALSSKAVSSGQIPPSKQSEQKSAKRSEHLADSKRDAAEIDWNAARDALARETKAYLKAANKLSRKDDATTKQFAAAAKPVYKAFKPFLTCPDEVCTFDACLACIRLIAQDAESRSKRGNAELPQTTYSLLGHVQKTMKTSVRKLIHCDEIVVSCTEELLRAEVAKPVYKTLPNSPLRQCLDIIDSKKQKRKPEPRAATQTEANETPEAKTEQSGTQANKRRRRKRRKKEPAERATSEKQDRNAAGEGETQNAIEANPQAAQ